MASAEPITGSEGEAPVRSRGRAPGQGSSGEAPEAESLLAFQRLVRYTMTDELLNGLALVFVHPDITLDYDAVIDEFGKSNRRLVLLVGLGLLNGTLLKVRPVNIQIE